MSQHPSLDDRAEATPLTEPESSAEARFRQMADTTPVMIWRSDPEGRGRWFNKRWLDFVGRTLDEEMGGGWTENVHPLDRSRCLAVFGEALSARSDFSMEYRLRRQDGEYRWLLDLGAPHYDPDGTFTGFIGSCVDITDRKRAEEAHAESEERFVRFMRHVPGLAWIKDVEGRYVFVNPAAEQAFRTGREDLYGKTDADIFPPDVAQQFQANDRLALNTRGGVQCVETLEHEDGILHHSIVSKFPIFGPAGEPTLIGGIAIDITERKRAEEALRASEERYRALVESHSEMICHFRPEGEILFANYAYARTFGLSPDELTGVVFWDVIAEEDRPAVRALLNQLTPETPQVRIENRVDTPDGQRWTLWTNRALAFDAAGVAVEVQSAGMDISDLKRAELSLQAADRLKDEFLATLAHELRNPLAPIMNSLHLLKLSHREPTDAPLYDIMERQVNHMVRLVDDLLEVSRITRGRIELRRAQVDVASVVRSAIETSRPAIDAGRHELTVELPARPVMIDADAVRVAQVISNLLNNAAKYTDVGGRIAIQVSTLGSEVAISVRDNGIGISNEALPHVFEMFTQVDRDHKRAQGGLGIGLALAKRLVEMHEGRITAESAGESQGSTFTVHLPCTDFIGPEAAALTGAQTDQGRDRRRILVVDDNQDAATSLAMMLRLLGNEVETANDGPTALQAIPVWRPAVILLDLGMPGMSGFEVAECLRQLPECEEAVLIAVTGWGQEEDRRRTREAGFHHHLVKPVNPATLTALLGELGV